MNSSLRALLAGSIDYAGMFPPAGLSLAEAIQLYRRHRLSPVSWMLGRFVVPAAQLADLAAIYDRERDGCLTVIVPAAESGIDFLKKLDEALTLVERFPAAGAVDMLEFHWPVTPAPGTDGSRLDNLVQAAAGQIVASRLTPLTMFFELPRRGSPAVDAASQDTRGQEIRAEEIRAAAAALAEYNQTARGLNCLAGFKLRCGGTQASEIPSSAEVALAICECRDRGVFWKATAGLHHPFRHIDPVWRVSVHGFLNLAFAGVVADLHHLDESQIQGMIDDGPREFWFSDETLAWRDSTFFGREVAAARERSFRSFGSCSFDEPCGDLTELALI